MTAVSDAKGGVDEDLAVSRTRKNSSVSGGCAA
jgi:hypothetical protein